MIGSPSLLGARRSLGFGDRLGFASAAFVRLARAHDLASVLVQRSPQDLNSTGRTAEDAVRSITGITHGFPKPWSAEVEAIMTPEQAAESARAGFTRLSIDPSGYFVEAAALLSGADLQDAAAALLEDGAMPPDWRKPYLGREFTAAAQTLRFEVEELVRIGVKLGWAVAYVEELWRAFAAVQPQCEVEVWLGRTETRTTPLEHLFVGLECRRRGIPLVTVAPHLPGNWEPAAAYEGDEAELENWVATHAAIATTYGPWQISISEVEGKDAVLPVISRAAGDRLHVKTGAASVLEAMRLVARVEPGLFREFLEAGQEQFPFARARKRISLGEDAVRSLPDVDDAGLEAIFLNDPRGAQFLDAIVGPVIETAAMREKLFAVLTRERTAYEELLTARFDGLIKALGWPPSES